jgi:hypothetical protein
LPDATGLELIAQDLRSAHGDDAVLGTQFFRNKAALDIAPVLGPVAATGAALLFVGAAGVRFRRGMHKSAIAESLYTAMAVFVAQSRFGPEPLV